MTADELLAQGSALRREGNFSAAIRLLDQAARLSPADPEIWLERGYVFDFGGSLDNALKSYAESARLGGGAAALAGYASVAVRKGDYAGAREAAQLALDLAPGEPTATIALARCDIEARAFADAEARLNSLLIRDDVASEERMIAGGLLGDVLDKLDRPAEAFASYTRSKALFTEVHAERFAGQPPLTHFVEEIGKTFASVSAEGWIAEAGPIDGAPHNHVFLLGYPRSGTTLVENILASAPGVAALEERPTLREADREFLDPPSKLVALSELDQEGLQPWREAYWQRVRAGGVAPEMQTFVDMDPLKGSRLPMIARLFPAAKIVAMRRDPRDVVLSCFRTSFAPTAAAYQFTTLDGVARHYDALMRLQQTCLAALPLAYHELYYERLVGDFDTTTRDLCGFLDIPWSKELRRFDKTAEARGVSTASQTQVRRGLYDGRAQWRKYETELAPVMPILQPWIEEFGYAGTP
ncbi:MAG TPA: sulfotransferase [Sphingomonas sp.]|nr:sulfotransferase [Sphingomonas sp.]